MKQGRRQWIPGSVREHIDYLKKQERIPDDAEAMRKMAQYSHLGISVRKVMESDPFKIIPSWDMDKPRPIKKKDKKRHQESIFGDQRLF